MIEIIDQNGVITPHLGGKTTIERAMMACFAALQNERSKATARTYLTGWKVFLEFLSKYKVFPEDDLASLRVQHFIDFPEWLVVTRSQPTLRIYYAGVKYFLEWLIIHNYLSPTPNDMLILDKAKKHAIQKLPRTKPVILEDDAVEEVLEAVRSLDSESPMRERNIAILFFVSSSGVRNAEACGLKIGDLDMRSRKATVFGKGSKTRKAKFSEEAAGALKDYWQVRGWGINKKDPVFARHDDKAGKTEHGKTKLHEPITTTTLRRIVKAVATAAGVEVHPHLLRHWYATKMYRKKQDLRAVQVSLGHASSKTTEIYAEPDTAEFDRAHDEVFGDQADKKDGDE